MEIPTEAAKENINLNGSHLPLVDLAVQIVPGLVSSYENLDTYTQLRGRTELTDEYAGFGLSSIHKDRIARIWRLISDVDLTDAISSVARSMHNHQCGDLIEIFTNIARLVWTQCIPPGGNLDQLAIDLIKQMITADVERYLDTAIEMKANGHTRPITQNPTSRHVITFEHRASGVTGPDRHHSKTFIRETEQAVGDLFNLITDIKTTLEGVQSNTEWISCGQQLGFRTYTPNQEERNRINSAISDLDLHRTVHPRHERVQKERELNPLPELAPRRPVTRSMNHGTSSHRRRTPRCIHCHSKYHRSEDHHLPLTIPAMPTLPARPTPRRRDLTPGLSTQAERRPRAPNPSSRRRPRNPPKKKKKRHDRSSCNRCVNSRTCRYAEEEGPDYDGFNTGDDYDFDEVAHHNMRT